jgi:hypothetical protein
VVQIQVLKKTPNLLHVCRSCIHILLTGQQRWARGNPDFGKGGNPLKVNKIENRSRATSRQWRVQRCTDEARFRLSRHRRHSRWMTEDRPKSHGLPSAADQSQWRRDASEFNELNVNLPKGKPLQSLLRIFIVFNEPNIWIICALIHDTLKRIRVRRIRKSANSMWPYFIVFPTWASALCIAFSHKVQPSN